MDSSSPQADSRSNSNGLVWGSGRASSFLITAGASADRNNQLRFGCVILIYDHPMLSLWRLNLNYVQVQFGPVCFIIRFYSEYINFVGIILPAEASPGRLAQPPESREWRPKNDPSLLCNFCNFDLKVFNVPASTAVESRLFQVLMTLSAKTCCQSSVATRPFSASRCVPLYGWKLENSQRRYMATCGLWSWIDRIRLPPLEVYMAL